MSEYTLAEFLSQIQKLGRSGQLRETMMQIPSMSREVEDIDEEGIQVEINQMTVMVDSMTQVERLTPEIIDAERAERIARGSGTSRSSVFDLMRQFRNMRNMMVQISNLGNR